jgi:hypothetical protein
VSFFAIKTNLEIPGAKNFEIQVFKKLKNSLLVTRYCENMLENIIKKIKNTKQQ